ncbi:MAG: hypothetical protein HY367_00410 [Candidatus Aenigmarchaeota archaeon]|nr:hypothetical protein [Candidatus Aenigmarchaeota archaeon]
MKVRDVKNVLLIEMGEARANDTLTKISHWVRQLHAVKEYATDDHGNKRALETLAVLKIAKTEERGSHVVAALTEEGNDLYNDFLGKGYYGSS